MKTLVENLGLVLVAKTIKGTSFVGIKNYENKQGEVSNQTIVAGITYENCLKNDLKVLQEKQNEVFETLQKDFPIELIETAYKNVYKSLETRLSSEEVKEALKKLQKLVEDIAQKTKLKFWDCHYGNIGYIIRDKKPVLVCIDTGKESFRNANNAWGYADPGPKCSYCLRYACRCK